MRKLTILALLISGTAMLAFAQSGKITGKLTYPSDMIPQDLVLCVKATSLYNEPVYCSNDRVSRLRAAKVSFRLSLGSATYEASLPAGTYLIYARTGQMPGIDAYYNDFIKCGMTVRCRSKRPIPVKVRPRQTTRGITVGDFW